MACKLTHEEVFEIVVKVLKCQNPGLSCPITEQTSLEGIGWNREARTSLYEPIRSLIEQRGCRVTGLDAFELMKLDSVGALTDAFKKSICANSRGRLQRGS